MNRAFDGSRSLDQARPRVAVAVSRRVLGRPPAWRELGLACGWPKAEVDRRVRELRVSGLRWRIGRRHSLNVGPSSLRAPFDLVREGRQEAVA